MTDFSSFLDSHTAPAAQLNFDTLPLSKIAPNASSALPPEDPVEDYTIKCICGYQDDDGNSVFCEKCDTWQHTECYYYRQEYGRVATSEELEGVDHSCADCHPRPLDVRGAVERQRSRKEDLDPSERKVKKPASKSHKKKTKAPDTNGIFTNGWSHGADQDAFLDRTSGSPRDHVPPAKRPKAHHKPSNSVTTPILPQQPTSHPHKRRGSTAHSPTKMQHVANGYARGMYSVDFVHLYDSDPGDKEMQTNLLGDISITSDLSVWAYDVEALKEATRGFSHSDVFHRIGQPISTMQIPQLCKQRKQDESVTVDGRHPTWTYLTVDPPMPKNSIVGELKGKIGHMKEYIQDPANRWDYLRHPAPFVFFHPKLPIYIDTRCEGSACRYLRRSCAPNLNMKTFLENESDYHFCFVAKDDIPPGAELTIGWVPDEHMRNFFNPNGKEIKQEFAGDEEDYITDWASKVLPEFGGCACGAPHTCTFTRYEPRSKGLKGRNGHSGKPQATLSNGYTPHSLDDSEQEDRRSTSESKSGSRDMTPTGNNATDSVLGPGMEISDRDKRKIAALEKRSNDQLENDKHQPGQKKKKRNSGGSHANTPGAATTKQLGHTTISFSQPNTPSFPAKPQFADAGTNRRKSGSPTAKAHQFARSRVAAAPDTKKRSSQPNTPLVRSPLCHKNYVSTGIQTDPDADGHWYMPVSEPAPPQKPFMSLTKRLMLRSQRDRARLEERRRSIETSNTPQALGVQTASDSNPLVGPQHQEDTDMPDVVSAQSSESRQLSPAMATQTLQPSERVTSMSDRPDVAESKPPPPARPPFSSHHAPEQVHSANGFSPADLSVQLPPKPMPSDAPFNSLIAQSPTSLVSRSPIIPAFLPLPAAKSIQPSPVKKLTLGDYMKRKGSNAASERPATGGSTDLQHSDLNVASTPHEENKTMTTMEDSAVLDTPKKEESDPLLPVGATRGGGPQIWKS